MFGADVEGSVWWATQASGFVNNSSHSTENAGCWYEEKREAVREAWGRVCRRIWDCVGFMLREKPAAWADV